jgi:hypothetical protein
MHYDVRSSLFLGMGSGTEIIPVQYQIPVGVKNTHNRIKPWALVSISSHERAAD